MLVSKTGFFHHARRRRFSARDRAFGTPHRGVTDSRGFTLLELLVVVSVLAVLMLIAVPSMQAMLTRNHLKAAAQSIAEDLQWTRSEAIKRNRTLRVAFDVQPWCYGIGEDATANCDCRLAPEEEGACSLKRRSGVDFPDIGLSATFAGTSFDPRRATANNGTLTLTARNGSSLKIVLSRLGRVRICSPSGALAGYASCGN
ncbi:type IV pilin [Thiocystis minor]|nr:type IV pilin [Thiocystis minor]